MSPVGKPQADGTVGGSPRHYGHGSGSLGEATLWDCPACGKKNEGRRPEQGCVHCGAGDPHASTAGVAAAAPAVERDDWERTARRATAPPVGLPSARLDVGEPAPDRRAEPQRVLRLIQYLIYPGQSGDETLRRSLVGRMELGWGSITATIVDSCDDRQEDLLRLAARQPGVWLGNAAVSDSVDHPYKTAWAGITPRPVASGPMVTLHKHPGTRMGTHMNVPDTGPIYTIEEQDLAAAIANAVVRAHAAPYALLYTLALALQTISEELKGNTEPEKFLSPEACLSLANALMNEIPVDWQNAEGEAPAPTTPGSLADETEQARREEIRTRMTARPEPIFREPPTMKE